MLAFFLQWEVVSNVSSFVISPLNVEEASALTLLVK